MNRFRLTLAVVLTGALAVGLVVATTASSSRSSGAKSTVITPSPVWTGKQLSAPAGADWLTYYGGLTGDRYSSLAQITPSNVGTLKQVWQMSLGTCTAALIAGAPVIPGASNGSTNNQSNCGSMESNPVAINGVLYTTNAPLGATFAIDAATGNILWTWTPTYNETLLNGAIFSPGSGGRRAGVAVGEGKVFVGLPDGRLVALDQTTGQEQWENSVGSVTANAKISTAPIYVNGMVLVGDGSGDSGGESPTLEAFRAGNGARVWSWSPVPAPGQPGYSTWTNNGQGGNGSTLYGGGSFWQSPVVDTARGIVVTGDGNPEPWNSRGPGQNLYTTSIVGLDLNTGKLKWYFQQVHHDMWDSDLPNEGVLFTGTFNVNGKQVTRPAVAYVNKVGMTFVLDEVTGVPLIPVKETPVPTSNPTTQPGVNAWPTQPVPATPNVLFNPIGKDGIPCTTPDAVTSAGVPYATATAPDGKPFHSGCAYTYYDTTQYTTMPFEMMDWPVSSYSPVTHTMNTCGVTGRATAMEQIPQTSQVASIYGGLGAGRLSVGDGSTPISNSGNYSEINVWTGKFLVHQHWPAICYSGSANTASGVTFVGQFGSGNGSAGDGHLLALDSKSGAVLWTSPTMPYPVGAAPITYQVNGKQYVTVEVGGAGHNDVTRPLGLLAPQRVRGDYVYTFALP